MNNFKKSLPHFFLIATVCLLLVQLAEATTTNFTVHGGEEVTRSLNLVIDDHVLIKFTVVGQSVNTLRFCLIYPNATVTEFGEVGDFSYSFVCDAEGEYTLHFSNKDSAENKLVTLNYEVQHYIFGIPQMLFLTIVIVIVCMAAIATFVLMGKTH